MENKIELTFLCDHCRTPITDYLTPEEIEDIKVKKEQEIYTFYLCDNCEMLDVL